MENKELEKVEVPHNYFENKEIFDQIQRVALMFSKSELVPKMYQGNPGNCVIALEMASRLKASPLLVMQNLYVIQGKPGWSSTFLIASVNACGKFSPLRYEEDDKDGGRTRAWAYDLKNNEKVYGIWVSMGMAKAEGWIDKTGSKWKTMPELMRRYRAASFFSRQFAPDVAMGMQTIEEVVDITPIQVTNINKEHERIKLMIQDCNSVEDLQKLEGSVPTELIPDWNLRMEQIINPA